LSPGTKIRIISGKEVGDFFQKEPEEIEKILAQLGKKLSGLYGEFRETKAALRAYKKKGEGDENLLREVSKLLSRSLLHPTLPERKPSDAELEARLEQETHEMKYEWEEAVPQKVKTFAPGQVIYREGEEAKNLYFVSGGCVGICHGYGTDKERLVGKIRETQFFGELGWMEGAPRYHTAVALEEDTRVDLISREDLMILTQKFPAFVLLILRDFSTQLRIMTADYQEACKELDAITREERRKRRYPM
ncbi:MAG: cyclic nucleotide-binding domain-containing protein, partial [Blautia sp.]|nr:cyclic nucleotide-binding domain-containing protein [Blautia sp.]